MCVSVLVVCVRMLDDYVYGHSQLVIGQHHR